MSNPVVQFSECPNSGKGQGTVCQASLPKATAQGATLVALATYSYDVHDNTAKFMIGGQELISKGRLSDTTGNGDQTFEMFCLDNAAIVPAGEEWIMTVEGTDYRGFVFAELIPGLTFADAKMAWIQNLTGAHLMETAPTAPGNGPIVAISFAVETSEYGAAPYLATIAGGQTLIADWFEYDQKNNAPLGVWCYEAQGSNPTYQPRYNSAAGSANDSYILGIMIFDQGSTPPPPQNKVTLTTAQVSAITAGQATSVMAPAAGNLELMPPGVAPPPPSGKVVIVQNGGSQIWKQNYSYNCNTGMVTPGNGNAACVRAAIFGPWAGYQPSNNPGQTTDFSQCSTISVDVLASVDNMPYTMQCLKAGDTPVYGENGAGVSVSFTGGPAGQWSRHTFDIEATGLMTDWSTGKPVDVRGEIYKAAVQEHLGSSSGYFEVDNWIAD